MSSLSWTIIKINYLACTSVPTTLPTIRSRKPQPTSSLVSNFSPPGSRQVPQLPPSSSLRAEFLFTGVLPHLSLVPTCSVFHMTEVASTRSHLSILSPASSIQLEFRLPSALWELSPSPRNSVDSVPKLEQKRKLNTPPTILLAFLASVWRHTLDLAALSSLSPCGSPWGHIPNVSPFNHCRRYNPSSLLTSLNLATNSASQLTHITYQPSVALKHLPTSRTTLCKTPPRSPGQNFSTLVSFLDPSPNNQLGILGELM